MTKDKTLVYKMDYALKLQKMGHKIVGVLPNPKKPNYDCWVFEIDETFYADFEEVTGVRRKED